MAHPDFQEKKVDPGKPLSSPEEPSARGHLELLLSDGDRILLSPEEIACLGFHEGQIVAFKDSSGKTKGFFRVKIAEGIESSGHKITGLGTQLEAVPIPLEELQMATIPDPTLGVNEIRLCRSSYASAFN